MLRFSGCCARLSHLLIALSLILTSAIPAPDAALARNPSAAPEASAARTEATPLAFPDPPINLRLADQSETSITVAWDAVAGAELAGYNVTYYVAGEPYTIGPIDATTAVLTGLEPNTAYTITVSSQDTDGNVSAESQPLTAQTAPAAPMLSLADLTISPTPLHPGATALVTMTIVNSGPIPATEVVVALPLPDDTSALPGPGLISGAAGWRWTLESLAAQASAVFTASLQIESLPAGRALLVAPELAAQGVPALREVRGELVTPAEPPTTESFTPGQPATLFNTGHIVQVDFPADGYAQNLTLAYLPAEAKRAQGAFVPPDTAGFKRGLGVFALEADDGAGNPVHQFDAPLTISVRYFEAQLKLRRIEESNLTLYWYDGAEQRWVALPTTVDPETRTASATVDHFSYYQLGDGSSPSGQFIPSLQGWQVSLFTGASSYAMPIAVPSGPGGMQPQLQLTYNSAQTDGESYKLTHKQSSWVGKGWDLSVPYIALNKTAEPSKDYFTLVLDGKSYTIARGKRIPGAPTTYSSGWLQGWEWHATDEDFIKIRAVRIGEYATGKQRYKWVVWTKGGVKYEFNNDVTWAYQNGTYEAYKWMLTSATDPQLNQITYQYSSLSSGTSCGPTVQPDIWPTSMTWGANIATGATSRYQVTFESSSRSSQGNQVVHGDDMTWDYPDTICSGPLAAPHQTRKLNAVKVWSMHSSSWQLVRQYDFDIDTGLYSDASVCPVSCTDTSGWAVETGYKKLRLKSVQLVGYDTTRFPNNTTPIKTTFAYQSIRDDNKIPRGGWNRLEEVNNGQTGTLRFAYANIADSYPQWSALFANRHRVTSKTVHDGRGNAYTWSYSYGMAAVNSLGTANGGKGPNLHPNSAPLFFWYKNGQPLDILAVNKEKEFRGHASVTETDPSGARTEHYFIQGEGETDTDNNPETALGCTPTSASSGNTCFQTMRDRSFQVGREWKTVWKTSSGSTPRATYHTFTSLFCAGTLHEPTAVAPFDTWPEHTRNGLWRAFTYESRQDERIYEDSGTPKVKTTLYAYDVSCSAADQQYGNLSRVEERDNGATVRVSQTWYNRRNDESWTWPANHNATFSVTYLVDRAWKQQVSDASGVVQSLSHSFYYDDAMAGAARPDTNVLGKRGLLWRVSSYRNASPCCTYPLYASDTTYGYDQYGNRTGETTYADEGRMTSATAWTAPGNGSAARTTTFEYDATFHALSTKATYPTVNGVTQVESASYSGSSNLGFRLGVPTSITDVNGNVTSAEYDKFGRITKVIRPGDSSSAPTTQFTYYDNENPVRYRADLRENSSGARTIQHFYDGTGRAIQTKSESSDGTSGLVNVVADTRYDGLDRVIEASQPRYLVETSTSFYQYTPPTATLFNVTRTKYDALGRVVEVIHPNTTKTTTAYTLGSYGTRVRVVDPNSHQIESNYDTFGRLRTVVEYSGESSYATYATTTYAYTSLDLLAQVTDNAGNITRLYYDSLGRKTRMDDPDMGTWYYSYDAGGNLKRQTDARGQRVCLFYDALNRPTGKHYNGASDSCPASPTTITYSYDQGSNGKGQRTAMSSPDATTSWSYDARGRRTQATHTVAGVTRVFAWAYDSADRVTRITYPTVGGVTELLDYTYDAGWRPSSACTSRGGCYVSGGATYTALDQPKRWVQGNNVVSRWTYSTYLQRLQQLQVGTGSCAGAACLFDRTYGYDNAGNVLSITDNKSAGNNQAYSYDHRDRLTSWTLGSSTQSYAYNTIGNLTAKAGHTYAYGDALHKHAVTNDGVNSYGYDAVGNQTTINGVTRYAWNAENLPSSITGADGVAESYGYDGDNERVKKVRSGATTIELEGLWEETIGGATKLYYPFNGQPVAVREGSTVTYLHGDHLGSIGLTTNTSGAIASQQEFDPWGVVRSGAIGQTSLNFTGQRLDGTGLLYYHARYYDPKLGRFISADTVVPGNASGGLDGITLKALTVDFHEPGLTARLNTENRQPFWFKMSSKERAKAKSPWGPLNPQALNRYSYVQNNPLKYTDPTGHLVFVPVLIVVGVVLVGGALIAVASSPNSGINWGDYDWTDWSIPGLTPSIDSSSSTRDEKDSTVLEARQSKKTPKERKSDVPSWVRNGYGDYAREQLAKGKSAKEVADEIFNDKYGEGNYATGPGSEYSKTKKGLEQMRD